MSTYFVKSGEAKSLKSWVEIDISGLVVGRVAAFVSKLLTGKSSPYYTPHEDCGHNVILINASKVVLTGNKYKDKVYYRHTGYMGGLKVTSARHLHEKDPCAIIKKAIERMMAEGPMARRRMKNLKVYSGSVHPHVAQQPKVIDLSAVNSKNKAAK